MAKPPNSSNPTGEKQAPLKKPMHTCGQDGQYGTLCNSGTAKRPGKKKNTWERDHIPSKTALFERAQTTKSGNRRRMSTAKQACVEGKLEYRGSAIVIPTGYHRKYSPTCGNAADRNSPTRIAEDAKNPKAAIKRDTDAMLAEMKARNHPCASHYEAAVKKLKTQEEIDEMIDDVIKECSGR